DILIDDNKIIKIEDSINVDCEILDANGCLVMPGAVDVHVHLREPGYEVKETIKSGTLSAAKAGVTTIMSMPNLKPVPDNLEALNVQLDIINKDAIVNVYPYGAVTVNQNDEALANIDEIHSYVKAITDDGFGVNNIEVLKEAMRLAKKYDLVIASHAEDSVYKYAPEGEYVAVRREIELAKEIGCKYHFCHMSTYESFEAIRNAQKEGYTNITCEVAPHHLVLNETMIKNPNWKMNPPLRSEKNRLATVEALLDGTACMVASDHAPHTKEEKSREYNKCPNGIIGLETMMPIIYTEFVRTGKISLNRFLDIMVYNPSKVFNLPLNDLKVGCIADIAVLDIENPHTYTEDEILSKGVNSPFIGNTYYGFTKYTLVNGKIAYKK
ncbi:MAG: dihydroorotase, partial [Acholeplasmatales bacterium]|nr:dihydroorotase [Acholeplasmatales bacterium]